MSGQSTNGEMVERHGLPKDIGWSVWKCYDSTEAGRLVFFRRRNPGMVAGFCSHLLGFQSYPDLTFFFLGRDSATDNFEQSIKGRFHSKLPFFPMRLALRDNLNRSPGDEEKGGGGVALQALPGASRLTKKTGTVTKSFHLAGWLPSNYTIKIYQSSKSIKICTWKHSSFISKHSKDATLPSLFLASYLKPGALCHWNPLSSIATCDL